MLQFITVKRLVLAGMAVCFLLKWTGDQTGIGIILNAVTAFNKTALYGVLLGAGMALFFIYCIGLLLFDIFVKTPEGRLKLPLILTLCMAAVFFADIFFIYKTVGIGTCIELALSIILVVSIFLPEQALRRVFKNNDQTR